MKDLAPVRHRRGPRLREQALPEYEDEEISRLEGGVARPAQGLSRREGKVGNLRPKERTQEAGGRVRRRVR